MEPQPPTPGVADLHLRSGWSVLLPLRFACLVAASCVVAGLGLAAPTAAASSGLFWTAACLKLGCFGDAKGEAHHDAGAIGRVGLGGRKPDPWMIHEVRGSTGIDASRRHLFWANSARGTISRARLDGTHVKRRLVSGLTDVDEIAVGGGRVFWSHYPDPFQDSDETGAVLGSATLSGKDVDRRLIDLGPGFPGDLEASDDHIYIRNLYDRLDPGTPTTPCLGGAVSRAKLDGSGYEPCFITGDRSEFGWDLADALAVSGQHLYFLTRPVAVNGTVGVGRAGLDGSQLTPDLFSLSQRLFLAGTEGFEAGQDHLYWITRKRKRRYIARASLDGSAVVHEFVAMPDFPGGLVVVEPEP